MIKAILIDVDNTLLDFNECAKLSARITANELGVHLPQDFYPTFREINDKLWRKIESGEIDKKRLHELRWATIFTALNVTADGAAFETLFRKNMSRCHVPVDGAQDLLTYLSAKYPLYVASNASMEVQLPRLVDSGLNEYFTGKFLSDEIGVAKPQTGFWQYCIDALGAKPHELIMIGDSPNADIGGARLAGLRTVWFNYDKLATDGVDCDYIVDTLGEIKDIL